MQLWQTAVQLKIRSDFPRTERQAVRSLLVCMSSCMYSFNGYDQLGIAPFHSTFRLATNINSHPTQTEASQIIPGNTMAISDVGNSIAQGIAWAYATASTPEAIQTGLFLFCVFVSHTSYEAELKGPSD